jgi:hypothetical protein
LGNNHEIQRTNRHFFVISLAAAVLAAFTAQSTLTVVPLASMWIMGIAYGVHALGWLIKGA